jgi:hypothetical protein
VNANYFMHMKRVHVNCYESRKSVSSNVNRNEQCADYSISKNTPQMFLLLTSSFTAVKFWPGLKSRSWVNTYLCFPVLSGEGREHMTGYPEYKESHSV